MSDLFHGSVPAAFVRRDWRPMDPVWVEEIREICPRHGTAFFFKQHGGRSKKKAGRELKGRTWDAYPTPAPAPA